VSDVVDSFQQWSEMFEELNRQSSLFAAARAAQEQAEMITRLAGGASALREQFLRASELSNAFAHQRHRWIAIAGAMRTVDIAAISAAATLPEWRLAATADSVTAFAARLSAIDPEDDLGDAMSTADLSRTTVATWLALILGFLAIVLAVGSVGVVAAEESRAVTIETLLGVAGVLFAIYDHLPDDD
jgi:hypothetical protein